jgi:hypothetical protein
MVYTNNKNLPLPLVRAIEKISSQYDKGESDFTATSLLKPVRMIALEAQNASNLSLDASGLIASVRGTVIHSMLEAAGLELKEQGFLVEERFYITVNGFKVGAKIDLFDTKTSTLYDWKTSSVYAVKRGLKEEHVQQLNIGAECLRQAGYTVNELRIAWFPMDYRSWEAKQDKKYPLEYSEVTAPIISSEEVLDFVESRIKAQLLAQVTLLENPKKFEKEVQCAPNETWGGKRCEKFCTVASLCKQYQNMKRGGAKPLTREKL